MTDSAGVRMSNWLELWEVRCKLVGFVGCIGMTACLNGWRASLGALGAALVIAGLGGLSRARVVRHLIALGLAALPFWLLLPWTIEDARPAWWDYGSLRLHPRGVEVAAAVTFRLWAIGLLASVWVRTTHALELLAALHRWGLPASVLWISVLTWQYAELLAREYRRLRMALRTRGFVLQGNWHTYRTIGQASGAVVVHSVERAERLAAAMRCRGFQGTFQLLTPLRCCHAADWVATASMWAIFAGLVLGDRWYL
jgi:cobalt/nickel transport system permease protein